MGINSRRINSQVAVILAALAVVFSCTTENTTPDATKPETQKDSTEVTPDPQKDTTGVDPQKDTTEVEPQEDTIVKPELVPPISKNGYKIATLWIDLTANIGKFRKKENVLLYLDRIQAVGFNAIVLDVKGIDGTVMYDSDFLIHADTVSGVDISSLDYDFVPLFIEECHKRDMRITLSTCVMTMGDSRYETSPEWKDLYSLEYLPTGMLDIREDTESGIFSFLNPCLPEVKDYAIRMAKELVTKYDFDGYALDYCRYQDYCSDFSEATHKAFEEYLGETVEDWPECVYTFKDAECSRTSFTTGVRYNDFLEFKASVIQGYVRDIRSAVKEIKPDVDIEYWASAWWPCWGTGQNWASPEVDRTGRLWCGSENYYKTGFADLLDIFQLGAYTSTVFGSGTQSIQGLLKKGKIYINGNCQMYGTFSACVSSKFEMADACYMCLSETDGLMVFDLSHVQRMKWWDQIKEGIMKYRNEYENN